MISLFEMGIQVFENLTTQSNSNSIKKFEKKLFLFCFILPDEEQNINLSSRIISSSIQNG